MKPDRRWVVALAAALAGAAVLVSIPTRANAPAGRYTVATGTVLDTKTQLTWQQAATFYGTRAAAPAYCATLNLNGAGWRLPTVKELLTLVDASQVPPIDTTAFPSFPDSPFWSATANAGSATQAWTVNFTGGNTGGGAKSQAFTATAPQYYALCVR